MLIKPIVNKEFFLNVFVNLLQTRYFKRLRREWDAKQNTDCIILDPWRSVDFKDDNFKRFMLLNIVPLQKYQIQLDFGAYCELFDLTKEDYDTIFALTNNNKDLKIQAVNPKELEIRQRIAKKKIITKTRKMLKTQFKLDKAYQAEQKAMQEEIEAMEKEKRYRIKHGPTDLPKNDDGEILYWIYDDATKMRLDDLVKERIEQYRKYHPYTNIEKKLTWREYQLIMRKIDRDFRTRKIWFLPPKDVESMQEFAYSKYKVETNRFALKDPRFTINHSPDEITQIKQEIIYFEQEFAKHIQPLLITDGRNYKPLEELYPKAFQYLREQEVKNGYLKDVVDPLMALNEKYAVYHSFHETNYENEKGMVEDVEKRKEQEVLDGDHIVLTQDDVKDAIPGYKENDPVVTSFVDDLLDKPIPLPKKEQSRSWFDKFMVKDTKSEIMDPFPTHEESQAYRKETKSYFDAKSALETRLPFYVQMTSEVIRAYEELTNAYNEAKSKGFIGTTEEEFIEKTNYLWPYPQYPTSNKGMRWYQTTTAYELRFYTSCHFEKKLRARGEFKLANIERANREHYFNHIVHLPIDWNIQVRNYVNKHRNKDIKNMNKAAKAVKAGIAEWRTDNAFMSSGILRSFKPSISEYIVKWNTYYAETYKDCLDDSFRLTQEDWIAINHLISTHWVFNYWLEPINYKHRPKLAKRQQACDERAMIIKKAEQTAASDTLRAPGVTQDQANAYTLEKFHQISFWVKDQYMTFDTWKQGYVPTHNESMENSAIVGWVDRQDLDQSYYNNPYNAPKALHDGHFKENVILDNWRQNARMYDPMGLKIKINGVEIDVSKYYAEKQRQEANENTQNEQVYQDIDDIKPEATNEMISANNTASTNNSDSIFIPAKANFVIENASQVVDVNRTIIDPVDYHDDSAPDYAQKQKDKFWLTRISEAIESPNATLAEKKLLLEAKQDFINRANIRAEERAEERKILALLKDIKKKEIDERMSDKTYYEQMYKPLPDFITSKRITDLDLFEEQNKQDNIENRVNQEIEELKNEIEGKNEKEEKEVVKDEVIEDKFEDSEETEDREDTYSIDKSKDTTDYNNTNEVSDNTSNTDDVWDPYNYDDSIDNNDNAVSSAHSKSIDIRKRARAKVRPMYLTYLKPFPERVFEQDFSHLNENNMFYKEILEGFQKQETDILAKTKEDLFAEKEGKIIVRANWDDKKWRQGKFKLKKEKECSPNVHLNYLKRGYRTEHDLARVRAKVYNNSHWSDIVVKDDVPIDNWLEDGDFTPEEKAKYMQMREALDAEIEADMKEELLAEYDDRLDQIKWECYYDREYYAKFKDECKDYDEANIDIYPPDDEEDLERANEYYKALFY